ncbi:MAG TPA: hypothetical protein VFB91_03070, partial [Terriglobales bacterium]|nr:hypothetical protein [Terriglobales bacterium]
MTMIGYFSRQAVQLRAGNRGQATALFLVVAATLLVVVFASIRLHHVAVARVTTADSVDAIALSAATWEARCLNLIAALNDGAIQCFRVIRWTSVVWAALAVAAATGYGVPAFALYTRKARKLIAGYWDTAHLLVSWSIKIRKAAPYLVLAEVAALSKERNVPGILFPLNPAGAHDGKNTLELHLAPGPPISLVDAIAPISAALNWLKRSRILKSAAATVISLLDAAIRAIVGTDKGPIRMLDPKRISRSDSSSGSRGSIRFPTSPSPSSTNRGSGGYSRRRRRNRTEGERR